MNLEYFIHTYGIIVKFGASVLLTHTVNNNVYIRNDVIINFMLSIIVNRFILIHKIFLCRMSPYRHAYFVQGFTYGEKLTL